MPDEIAQPAIETIEAATLDTATTDAAAPVEEPVQIQSADDLWNQEAELPIEETDTPPEIVVDEVKPPDTVEGATDASTAVPAEDVEPQEDYPLKMNRKDLRQFDQSFISVFRNPEIPIADAYSALHAFLPTRAEALAQEILDSSVASNPDQWMRVLLGNENITVEQVKERLNGINSEPQQITHATPLNNGLPPAISKVVEELTKEYGEDWRDAVNDEKIAIYDLDSVQATREMLSALESGKSETEKVRKELDGLKPKIDEIEANQKTEVENKVKETYQTVSTEYRTKVESASLAKLLADKSLAVSEADTPEVKAVKESVSSQFKPYYGMASNFDIFVTNAFSERENFAKIINRTDKHLSDASEKIVKAQRSNDLAEQQRLNAEAQALRAEADREQDALQVYYHKAASEFLDVAHAPVMNLLSENANLKRQLALNGQRVEITDGGAATFAGNANDIFEKARQEKINPFDLDAGDIVQKRVAANQ